MADGPECNVAAYIVKRASIFSYCICKRENPTLARVELFLVGGLSQ